LKRPAIVPVPALALKLAFGDMSEVLLASQRVAPKVAEASGYRFQFTDVGAALADVLK
jgi:NAD dependent epimerase/dehydratase family enzyme